MKIFVRLVLAFGVFSILTGCPKVPISGRRSLILLPASEEMSLGVQSYREVLKNAKVSNDVVSTAIVKRVGARIAAVSDRPDYQWEYTLIEDSATANAFCLPGGKVAVYSGILAITKTETGLAVVMGHEIAHAIARHGAERMSEQMLITLGGVSLAVAMQNKPRETQDLYNVAYGVGVGVGVSLPFGRYQEKEADQIGLHYMAKAGYDPREAMAFWRRMETASGGKAPPQFLSTHPSHEKRVQNLEGWMPDAVKIFEEASRKTP